MSLKLQVQMSVDVEATYQDIKDRLRVATIERAQRIIDNWELAFAPDERDRELSWQIFELRRQYAEIERARMSAQRKLMFIGCQVRVHKTCRRTANGVTCYCECHSKEAR